MDDEQQVDFDAPEVRKKILENAHEVFDFDGNATEEAKQLLNNIPRMYMPHAWVVHTHMNQFIRVGFEKSDLIRNYDDPDVLMEVEQFYRQSMMIPDDDDIQLIIVPIVPQGAALGKSVKDFVQLRGWYSVTERRISQSEDAVSCTSPSDDSLYQSITKVEDTLKEEMKSYYLKQETRITGLEGTIAAQNERLAKLERALAALSKKQ